MRASPSTTAYYEIFHEVLETLTASQAKQIDFTQWDSRHPVSSPYFLEFLPFLKSEGGISGFSRSMAYETFLPVGGPDADLSPAEISYVDRLVSAASSNKKIPLLSCTRSLGRSRALRRAFGGRTVFLHRNLFHQWASYCGQAEGGNPFFLETIRATVTGASDNPYLRSLADWFDIKNPSLPPEDVFQVFVLLHLYLYSIAFDAADLLVDFTAIARDRHLRQIVEFELSQIARHDIDLSDIHQTFEINNFVVESPRAMRDTIEQFAKLIPADTVSPKGVAFVDQAKNMALMEWERHEFFNRKSRSVWTHRIAAIDGQLSAQFTRGDALQSEVERLTLQYSNLSNVHLAEHTAHTEALAVLSRERDSLAERLSASDTARGLHYAANAEALRRVINERNACAAQTETLEAALHQVSVLHAEAVKRLTDQQSALVVQLEASEAARMKLEASMNALSAEAKDLRDELFNARQKWLHRLVSGVPRLRLLSRLYRRFDEVNEAPD
ncbi:hypothetical protein [Beijerinckia sp. L45]|uniref:hypothetical protein n=1 Tax=Beijerinckia sp. L45 TaxID=1641855 RepID=UPI00131E72FD|nr:hypothetical protein [Beijerinckia sp. L45]